MTRKYLKSVTGALLAALSLAAAAQSPPRTPLNNSNPAEYPDGSRLQSMYVLTPDAPVMSDLRAGATPSEIGARAMRDVQSRLATGFRIVPSESVRVMSRAPKLADAKAALAGDSENPAKVVTLSAIEYKGVPLARGSDYLSIATDDGRVLLTRQRNLPSSVDATTPTVTASAAGQFAKAAETLRAPGTQLTLEAPRLEIWVDAEGRGHLAWDVLVQSTALIKPRAMRYWVAATGTAKVLRVENEIYNTHHGVVSGTLWTTSSLQATASRALGSAQVARSTDAVTAVTGADGRYAYTTGGSNATISSALTGTNSGVLNLAGTVLSTASTGTPNNDLNLNFGAASEFELAQVSAFYWTNVAHDLAGNILLPADLPSLITRVNINSTCNAFWNGNSINFFRAGGVCPNTAYSDVVMHEYGHGIDARKGGIVDGGYSEGFGDAVAVLGTHQACVGRDFFGAATCLRPATDLVMWPPAPGTEVHAVGRRYAGFTWELTQQLRNTYSEEEAFRLANELVMASAAANPANIPDAVFLSFVADDTDGNLATCSPHFKELAAAADSRNIPRPPNCAVLGGGSPGTSNHFPWTLFKKVGTNSNILTVTLHLNEPMEVHLSADSSVRNFKGRLPRTFTTGLWDQPAPNVMWTNSLRNVTVPAKDQWVHFGTEIGVQLPAGDHTFFWKIWTSGGELEFSSGTMFAEAFRPAYGRRRGALAPADGSSDARSLETTTIDEKNVKSAQPTK